MRSTASLTGKAVERFQNGCNDMLQKLCSSIKEKLLAQLHVKGMSKNDIDSILSDVQVDNPFRNLKTIEDQLSHFQEKFSLPKPLEKYLDHRTDKRLDPKSNSYVPKQVCETFQSVSVCDTLKAILSDKKMRNLIFKELVSKDGIMTSFVDGYSFKHHPFLLRHKMVIHILLFYDELEVANALGSKTIIHKLGAFFYQILNLPSEMLSKMSSIHLLALVNADDMKKPDAFRKVLTPFIQEMKKLSSDEGVKMNLGGEECVVRALLTALTADTLAAHDVLGLLGPGARHFCRKCMVSRAEVRADANAMGPPRTKELHQEHLEKVARWKKSMTETGVKGPCPLDEIPFFSCVENCVFDAFHDVLEGIVPLVLKLVLREYVINQKLFSVKDLNGNIAAFCFGIPDSKNKPSANFTSEMLSKKRTNIKQSGSQMWCLARSLPFLIADYLPETEEVNSHMKLIFLLQDIMQIVFSFEITVEDIAQLEKLIFDHNALFENLFIKTQTTEEDEEGIDIDSEEEDVDDPAAPHEEILEEESGEVDDNAEDEQAELEEGGGMYVINKLHHLKHYPDMIRQYGNPVKLWCAKFEGRLKIFRQHSSICCNFKNICKTMAEMFQLSNLKSIRGNFDDDGIEHQKATVVKVKHFPYCDLLKGQGLRDEDEISLVNSVTVNGEEYRPGLFVVLPGPPQHPAFGLIREVVVTGERSVIFIVKPWQTVGRCPRLNTFQVLPEEDEEVCKSVFKFQCQ
ncbi:hypothetical protein ONE63_008075 [Megalurothrips usitatus]|uniref:Uncharacterized protein n=1 Tax=Megalurothrips usitatus TaxID=439358 RepID=A0AAV7XS71_9NEOP|nr:hypothetical protein ONE63_008075 [Megalurothrips usitatus]